MTCRMTLVIIFALSSFAVSITIITSYYYGLHNRLSMLTGHSLFVLALSSIHPEWKELGKSLIQCCIVAAYVVDQPVVIVILVE